MITIRLQTLINAPVQTCFDLSRSIDLHTSSMQYTGERAVSGVTSGLISLNESVTWEARHFGIRMRLTSKITVMDEPHRFIDEQQKGPFRKLKHQHLFEEVSDGVTMMTDELRFESPVGWLGSMLDKLILKRYMSRLLQTRNSTIKNVAEQLEVLRKHVR